MQREVKYNGLHKRDSYEGLVDYLANKQPKVKFPDRWAKRVRESPYLTNLDYDGSIEIRDQQEEAMKFEERRREIIR